MKNRQSNTPPAKTFQTLTLLLLTLTLLAFSGCDKSTHITTFAAGHPINATIDGTHSIDTEGYQGLISSKFGNIRIQSARVQLDNGQWTKIPEQVPVNIRITKRKLKLNAGSVTIERTIS